jgi:hypothetical protein
MRLLCLHADTVQALQRLGTTVDDLTPAGLWDTPYHLVTVSAEQRDALQRLRVTLDDVTPTALRDAAGDRSRAATAAKHDGSPAASEMAASPSPS